MGFTARPGDEHGAENMPEKMLCFLLIFTQECCFLLVIIAIISWFSNTFLVILGDLMFMPSASLRWSKYANKRPTFPPYRMADSKCWTQKLSVVFLSWTSPKAPNLGQRDSPRHDAVSTPSRGPCVGRWRVIPTAHGSWNRLGSFATGEPRWDEDGPWWNVA